MIRDNLCPYCNKPVLDSQKAGYNDAHVWHAACDRRKRKHEIARDAMASYDRKLEAEYHNDEAERSASLLGLLAVMLAIVIAVVLVAKLVG